VWDVQGDSVTIAVSYGELDATFTGSWREDGTFAGGWRPNPGADESVNVPTTSAGTVSNSSAIANLSVRRGGGRRLSNLGSVGRERQRATSSQLRSTWSLRSTVA
jgi:hypothetical protein